MDGWKAVTFCRGLRNSLVPDVDGLLSEGPIVLFVDGHYSHLSLPLVHTAREKGVHIFCLPPHTTHVLHWMWVYTDLSRRHGRVLSSHTRRQLWVPTSPKRHLEVSSCHSQRCLKKKNTIGLCGRVTHAV